jgi:hypothetical protein
MYIITGKNNNRINNKRRVRKKFLTLFSLNKLGKLLFCKNVSKNKKRAYILYKDWRKR